MQTCCQYPHGLNSEDDDVFPAHKWRGSGAPAMAARDLLKRWRDAALGDDLLPLADLTNETTDWLDETGR